jgi:hypothetical protein
MSDFLSVAFQSSLTTEGILFAAFGFLYAAYCQYSAIPTPEHPKRAPVANTLVKACRITTGIIALNAALAIYSLFRVTALTGIENMIISVGFTVTMIVIVFISVILVLSM